MQTVDAGKSGHNGLKAGACGFFTAFFLSAALFVAAAFVVLYMVPGYYEDEYNKYDVLSALPVEMTMSAEDGVMAVSNHMMKYLLNGEKAEDLQIAVTVDGETRDFFTEREIAHMWDVRQLFAAALFMCRMSLAAVILIQGAAWFWLFREEPDKKSLIRAEGKGIAAGTLCFVAAGAVLAGVICTNFSKAFVKFHLMFFDNDLWLLDPAEDLMINLLPESFFADTALRIAAVYAVFMLVMLAAGLFLSLPGRRKEG